MSNCIYYTYWILNIRNHKSYIGKRQTTLQNPYDDIGINYFSSSSDKNFIQDQKDHPEDYVYYVLGVFDNPHDQSKNEQDIQLLFNVNTNKAFYNRSIATRKHYTTGVRHIHKGDKETTIDKDAPLPDGWEEGYSDKHKEKIKLSLLETFSKRTDEERKIISQKTRERFLSEEYREKHSGVNHPNYNKKHYHNILTGEGKWFSDTDTIPENFVLGFSDEALKKKSISMRGKMDGENNPNYKKKFYHNPETKKGGFYTVGKEPKGFILGNTEETISLKRSLSVGRKLSDSAKEKLSLTKIDKRSMIKGDFRKDKLSIEEQRILLKDGWVFKNRKYKKDVWMKREIVSPIPYYLVEYALSIGYEYFDMKKDGNARANATKRGQKRTNTDYCTGSNNANYGNRKLKKDDFERRAKQPDQLSLFIDGWRFTKKNKCDIIITKNKEITYVPEYMLNDLLKLGWVVNENK